MEKFFNIAGPCNPAKHYMLPATARLPGVMRLVEREQYFAIHAARQSGKTTLLQGLVDDINATDERLDLCVEFRGRRYAVEVKTAKNFKVEDSYTQLAGYLDKLGLPEGWMAVFDEDKTKPWEEKLFARDVEFNGKTLHVIGL